jgi:hypothetical protein
MRITTAYSRSLAALALAAVAAPAGATTLRRASVQELAAANGTIVVGRVLDARSYWNEERTFILTDVRVTAREVLKGSTDGADVTVTLLGGTVDGETSLILAGAELREGRDYVLFLDEADLPGARAVRTIPAHAQGVFEIVAGAGGEARAVSEAARHALLPDSQGATEAPGGEEGLSLRDLQEEIHKAVAREEVVR